MTPTKATIKTMGSSHPKPSAKKRTKRAIATPTRRVITRSQTATKKATFLFLSLPPELRNMVYKAYFNFDGITRLLEKAEAEQCDLCAEGGRSSFNYYSHPPTCTCAKTRSPKPKMGTPSLLLLNKQITHEATPFVYTSTLSITAAPHNLPLQNVISPTSLRKIQHVYISFTTIPRSDQETFPPRVPQNSLLQAFVEGVEGSEGHSLQTLTVRLDNPELRKHVQGCMRNRNCFYWSRVVWWLTMLRQVKGVKGEVRIEGIWDCDGDTAKTRDGIAEGMRGLVKVEGDGDGDGDGE